MFKVTGLVIISKLFMNCLSGPVETFVNIIQKKLFINVLVKSFKKYIMESFSSEVIQTMKTVKLDTNP